MTPTVKGLDLAHALAQQFIDKRRVMHGDLTMMMAAPKRVIIYTRVSLDRTGEGLAVDRQLERCRKHIAAKEYAGWKEVAHFSDNSISAYTGKHRPGWEQVLGEIRAGRADIVIAWHMDRMTRSMVELEELILLCETNGVDIATIEGDIDLSSHMGRMVARILAAVARAEVEQKTARQLLKWDQVAAAGKPFTGGIRAFGYARDRMTLVEAEADAIAKAAREYLAGKPLINIAREWDLLGLRSDMHARKGSEGWTSTGVRQILTNPRYAGIRMHRGEPVVDEDGNPIPAAWPAIITEDMHQALLASFKRKERHPDRKAKGPGVHLCLLSGIIVCQMCGAKASAGRRDGRGIYQCSSPARHFSVQRDDVDPEVSAAVIAFLTTPGVSQYLAPDDDGGALLSAQAEAGKLRARLAQLGDDYADGLIERETMLRSTERLRERLAEAEEVITKAIAGTPLDGFPIGTAEAAELWDELELHQKRGIIEMVTKEIILRGAGPGRRFNAQDQLTIHFVGNAQPTAVPA